MIQAFTDLVGTSAVPALSINIDELTELTPALDTAAIDHGLSVEASVAFDGPVSSFGWCSTQIGC